MSFTEVMAELPTLSVAERQILFRRALDLDESSFSPTDEDEIERRLAAHRTDPARALSFEEMTARLRAEPPSACISPANP